MAPCDTQAMHYITAIDVEQFDELGQRWASPRKLEEDPAESKCRV